MTDKSEFSSDDAVHPKALHVDLQIVELGFVWQPEPWEAYLTFDGKPEDDAASEDSIDEERDLVAFAVFSSRRKAFQKGAGEGEVVEGVDRMFLVVVVLVLVLVVLPVAVVVAIAVLCALQPLLKK